MDLVLQLVVVGFFVWLAVVGGSVMAGRHGPRLSESRYNHRYWSVDSVPPVYLVIPLSWAATACVAVATAVAVALTVSDWLVGFVVLLGGTILGALVTVVYAFGFPEADSRWLRLGDVLDIGLVAVFFVGPITVVVFAALALVV